MSENGGWQPIETAPKDGTPILAYGEFQWQYSGEYWREEQAGKLGVVAVSWWTPDWLSADDSDDKKEADLVSGWVLLHDNPYKDFCHPTHWQPLPEPPGDAR